MLSTIWKDETPSDTIKRLLKCCWQHDISIMSTILLLFLLLLLAGDAASNSNQEFLFLGQLKLNASAEIQTNGSVTAVNSAGQHKGQAFYTLPLQFKNSSFSTSFVFFINQLFPVTLKEGIAFVIASSKTRHDSSAGDKQENAIEDIFSIAFFTKFSWRYREVSDADNYMVISLNDETLIEHSPLNYYADGNGELKKVELTGGEPVQVWVEYDGRVKKLNVTLSPLGIPKPSRPLLSIAQDLSPFVSEDVYVGISTYNSATLSSHYILGWSFKLNGQAQEFDPSQLAKLTPRQEGFRNWTIMSVTCHCVSSDDHLKLPLNYSEEDRRLQGIRRRLKGKI